MLSRQGFISHAEACSSGAHPRDVASWVRTGRWIRIRKGMYADAAVWAALDEFTDRPLLRIRAAHHRMGFAHRFSHDSAALLHGLGVPDARTALIHVTRPTLTGTRIGADVKNHAAPHVPAERVTVLGLPALGLARTAIDMVREHGLDGGVPVVDQVLRRGVSLSELTAVSERMRSWPHSRTIRAALELADPGSESWLESTGRLFVVGLGLGSPETQFGLSDGHTTAFADLRVGRHLFEIDGKDKYRPVGSGGLAHDPEAVVWREKRRRDFLMGFRLGMSRLTAFDLGAGREAARRRVLREVAATRAAYGDDITDLARFRVRRAA